MADSSFFFSSSGDAPLSPPRTPLIFLLLRFVASPYRRLLVSRLPSSNSLCKLLSVFLPPSPADAPHPSSSFFLRIWPLMRVLPLPAHPVPPRPQPRTFSLSSSAVTPFHPPACSRLSQSRSPASSTPLRLSISLFFSPSDWPGFAFGIETTPSSRALHPFQNLRPESSSPSTWF